MARWARWSEPNGAAPLARNLLSPLDRQRRVHEEVRPVDLIRQRREMVMSVVG